MRQIMIDATVGVLTIALLPVIAVGGLLTAIILKAKQLSELKN